MSKSERGLKGNRLGEAQSNYRSAIRANPKDPELQVQLGCVSER